MNCYFLFCLIMSFVSWSAQGMSYQVASIMKSQQKILEYNCNFSHSEATEVEIARRDWMLSRGRYVLDMVDRLQDKRKELYVLAVKVCRLTKSHYELALTDKEIKDRLEAASCIAMEADASERPSRADYSSYLDQLKTCQDDLSVLEREIDNDITRMSDLIVRHQGPLCCCLL